MNKEKVIYLIDVAALLLFTALTVAAVGIQEITIFYVIYVFWWDEIIKTGFDFLRSRFKKNEIKDLHAYKATISSRFFMLFIYIVFIIVCFGFIIEWNTRESIYKNAQILLFQNVYFNISILSFTARELYVYSNSAIIINTPRNTMSNGIITLHISIIFGLLLWAVASKRLGSLPVSIEEYSTALAIAPFLIIKFLFEWFEIKLKNTALVREKKDKQ